jgi:hypothetical protein
MNTSTVTDPLLEERRIAALLRQAPLEFARAVYGLRDTAQGRTWTAVAADVARTELQGSPVTRDRAQQRSRGYLPLAGHAHCPRCWVFGGVKNPLHFRAAVEERPEAALCDVCGAEYLTTAPEDE